MSCVHSMWMFKVDSSSQLLLQRLLMFCDDASKYTFRVWSQLQFCICGNLFFSIEPFHLVFVVTSKIKLILFLTAVTSKGRKFDMLMYPDHLENWLDFGHHLLIFFILAAFWLSETDHICNIWTFSWEHKGGMASNLACWCFLTTSGIYSILVTVCCYSSFWRHFDLMKQVKFGVSGILVTM